MATNNMGGENAILKDFLTQLYNYPLLSADEEVELESIIHNPNATEEEIADARERMINCNLRLVVNVAKGYRNFHLSLMDLIQEGSLGLMTAVEKYDPTLLNPNTNKPYRFSTLAVTWIKQAISKAIADKGKMIRNPAHVIQQITAYNRTVLRLSEQLGREPTDQEVAVELNVDANKIANYKKWKRETVSLDTKLDDESDDSVVDLVADDKPLPSEVAIEEDNNRIIQEVISSLDTRTEVIMRLRYGLGKPTRPETIELIKTKGWDTIKDEDFDEQNTLEVIGEKIHLTRERVRQIEKKTLAELQSNKKLQSIK